jgi:hypothetical protein
MKKKLRGALFNELNISVSLCRGPDFFNIIFNQYAMLSFLGYSIYGTSFLLPYSQQAWLFDYNYLFIDGRLIIRRVLFCREKKILYYN